MATIFSKTAKNPGRPQVRRSKRETRGVLRRRLHTVLAVLGLACLGQRAMAADYDPNWERYFRIGPFVGLNLKANFQTTGTIALGAKPPGVYDDGYVLSDNFNNPLTTSNWGYQNNSQYDATSQAIKMHRTTSFTADNRAEDVTDTPRVGVDLGYGGMLWHKDYVRVGWEFGFGWLPIKITDRPDGASSSTGVEDVYGTGGMIPPAARYDGTLSGFGAPLLDRNPSSSTPYASGLGTITGTRALSLDLYTVRLGPTVFLDLSQYFGLSLGLGGVAGFASGRLEFDEVIDNGTSISHSTGHVGATRFTYGAYANAILTYHVEKNGDLFLGVQYMPMTSATWSGLERRADLKLSGQVCLSIGINWPF